MIKAGSEAADSPICTRVVQGAYPVQEHGGIVFAYLGPPQDKPQFLIFDTEFIPDANAKPFSITTPCNWLQVYENTQDPIHVLHLHARTISWRYFSPRLDPRGQDDAAAVGKESIDFIGQTQGERSYHDRQRQPGDCEEKVSQRPIAIHALENRASLDAGVVRLRRLIRALADGEPARQRDWLELQAIPTYTQDTVSEWRGVGEPDVQRMRVHGRHVVKAVLESKHLPPAAREQRVKFLCEDAGH